MYVYLFKRIYVCLHLCAKSDKGEGACIDVYVDTYTHTYVQTCTHVVAAQVYLDLYEYMHAFGIYVYIYHVYIMRMHAHSIFAYTRASKYAADEIVCSNCKLKYHHHSQCMNVLRVQMYSYGTTTCWALTNKLLSCYYQA
jgi:hypothetical protein